MFSGYHPLHIFLPLFSFPFFVFNHPLSSLIESHAIANMALSWRIDTSSSQGGPSFPASLALLTMMSSAVSFVSENVLTRGTEEEEKHFKLLEPLHGEAFIFSVKALPLMGLFRGIVRSME